MSSPKKRVYPYCAKGGHPKGRDDAFVCSKHKGSIGLFTHCAVCGRKKDRISRTFSCGPGKHLPVKERA